MLTEITDIREYCKLAERTSSTAGKEFLLRLRHCTDGFTTETGEMVDVLKRHEQYGKPIDEKTITNLIEELGDQIWYWAEGCHALGVDPALVLARNIEKLRVRFPEKFTNEQALNRDLNAELDALKGISQNASAQPTT